MYIQNFCWRVDVGHTITRSYYQCIMHGPDVRKALPNQCTHKVINLMYKYKLTLLDYRIGSAGMQNPGGIDDMTFRRD